MSRPDTAQEPLSGMILAAGSGRRLLPLTLFRAKPAIPFLNRPLIQYSLELLRRARVQRIVINLHHLAQTVKDSVGLEKGDAGLPSLAFSHEEVMLGTAGGIGRVRDFFDSDPIVVCNGKIYFEEDLGPAIRFHQESQSLATLVAVPYSPADPFINPLFMDRSHNITGFAQGRAQRGSGEPYVFTGVHILSRQVLDFIPEGVSDTVKDIYPQLIARGLPVRGFLSHAYWCECSSPRRYLEQSIQVLGRRGLENLIESDHFEADCRNVIAAPSAQAEGGSVLENCIVWERARLRGNSFLRNVILASGVSLPPHTQLKDAVVIPLAGRVSKEVASGGRIYDGHLIYPLDPN